MELRSLPSPCSSANSLSTDKKAAKVLPVPVGDTINTFLPPSIFGHASTWAGVGDLYFPANHSVTGDFFNILWEHTSVLNDTPAHPLLNP